MAPPRIPEQIVAHGLRFPIYRLGDGRLAFDYKDAGVRKVVKRQTLQQLKEKADEVALSIVNAETAVRVLTAEDRRIYVSSRDALAQIGLTLDAAARLIVNAVQVVGSADKIQEACRHYAQSGAEISHTSTAEVVSHFLRNLRADTVSDSYITKLEADLGKFSERFPCAFSQVRSAELGDWIYSLEIGPRRRRKIRDQIVTLANFARDNGYLPQGLRTEAEKVRRPKISRKAPALYTPHELDLLITQCAQASNAKGLRDYTSFLPALTIGAFAGLRWAEILRLEWRHIHWEDQVIEVGEENKTGYRLVPIQPNLMTWLAPYREKNQHGPICLVPNRRGEMESCKYPDRVMRSLGGRAGLKVGGHKYANALRHSCVTYRVAITKNMPQIACESGHSVAELKKSYNRASLERVAEKWFAIRRDAQNVLQMPLFSLKRA